MPGIVPKRDLMVSFQARKTGNEPGAHSPGWMWGGYTGAVGAPQRWPLACWVGGGWVVMWKLEGKWTLSRQTRKRVKWGPLVVTGEQQREISACEEGRGLLGVAVVQVRMCVGEVGEGR